MTAAYPALKTAMWVTPAEQALPLARTRATPSSAEESSPERDTGGDCRPLKDGRSDRCGVVTTELRRPGGVPAPPANAGRHGWPAVECSLGSMRKSPSEAVGPERRPREDDHARRTNLIEGCPSVSSGVLIALDLAAHPGASWRGQKPASADLPREGDYTFSHLEPLCVIEPSHQTKEI